MICYDVRGVDHPLSQKMKIVPDYLTKPQNSNKQDSISFFVGHGPQKLTILFSMVRFKSLGHDCAIQYLKPTILASSGFPDQSKTGSLGNYVIRAKVLGSRDPISYSEWLKYLHCTYLGSYQFVMLKRISFKWVGPPIILK